MKTEITSLEETEKKRDIADIVSCLILFG